MHSGVIGELFGTASGFIVLVQGAVAEQEPHMFPGPPIDEAAGTPGKIGTDAETADMVKRMKPGSVLVDVAIDQGGCFETSRPTTHEEPTYVVDDVVHYCVANMPGAVPQTSTHALNNATLHFALALADTGAKQAMLDDHHLLGGLNVCGGVVTEEHVATALGYD